MASEDNIDHTVAISADDVARQMNQQKEATIPAKLICLDDTHLPADKKNLIVELNEDEIDVGRGDESKLTLAFQKISRHHARIYCSSDSWWIEDLGSTNGVWVNNEKTDKQKLNSGDVVRFASIPFRFELEQPKLVNQDTSQQTFAEDDGDDKTMMFGAFGDLNASEALLNATETVEKEVQKEQKEQKERKKESIYDNALPIETKESRPMNKLISLIVIVALLGGGGFFYVKHQEQETARKLVLTHSKEIKRFIDDYDVPRSDFTESAYNTELNMVRQMLANIDSDISSHKTLEPLYELKAKAMFLKFERNINQVFKADNPDGAHDIIENAKPEMIRLKSKLTGSTVEIDEIIALIDIADMIIRFKNFVKRFPDPADIDAETPSEYDIKQLQRKRKEFVSDIKRYNKILTVVYPYFNRIVSDVNDRDLRMLDRWQAVIRDKKESNK